MEKALAAGDDAAAAVVAFLFVPESEPALRSALRRCGLVRFNAAVESTLTMPGSSFADYEGSLVSSRRGNLRRAYNDVRAWHTTFAREPLADHVDVLVDMLVADRVHLTLARAGGEVVGFSVMLDTEPGIRHLMSQGLRAERESTPRFVPRSTSTSPSGPPMSTGFPSCRSATEASS